MAQACTGTRTLQKIEQLEQFVPLIYSNILYADERHRQRTEITSCWPGSNGRHEMTACIVVKLHHGGSGGKFAVGFDPCKTGALHLSIELQGAKVSSANQMIRMWFYSFFMFFSTKISEWGAWSIFCLSFTLPPKLLIIRNISKQPFVGRYSSFPEGYININHERLQKDEAGAESRVSMKCSWFRLAPWILQGSSLTKS